MARLTALAAAAIAALVVVGAHAAGKKDAPPVFQGTWIATAGPARALHGSWSAQALPGQPDDMQGSWSMVDGAGEVVAKGTWSAHRSRGGFSGKWAARDAAGGVHRGSYEAHLPGFKGKTLESMFAATRTRQISGFWHMGGATGAWYLNGPG